MYFISRYSKLTEIGLQLSWWMRWLISAALLIAIVTIWYFFAYSLFATQLKELIQKKQMVASEQTGLNQITQKIQQLDAVVTAQKSAWNTKAQHLREHAGHDNLFALFEALGKQGIAIEAYYPRGSVDRGWYTKMCAQIHLLVSFDQLLALFDMLSSEKIPYYCEHVRLERRDNHIWAVVTLNQKIPKDV